VKQLLFAIAILLFLVSCDQKPKNPVSEYGETVIDAYKKGQAVKETADLDAIKKTIQAYHAANDRYPANLDEIANLIGKQIDMAKYDYDPQTGAVNLKK